MTTEEILDEFTLDGLEVEVAAIETAGRALKTLRLLEMDHTYKRDAAEDRANELADTEDKESYQRWMDIFWKENRAVEFIRNTLKSFNVE